VGLVCDQGKCRTATVALGATCGTAATAICPAGARCATISPTAIEGTCVALKKVGAPCTAADECERGASCTSGVCVACK
jgi:hypothetical protein